MAINDEKNHMQMKTIINDLMQMKQNKTTNPFQIVLYPPHNDRVINESQIIAGWLNECAIIHEKIHMQIKQSFMIL